MLADEEIGEEGGGEPAAHVGHPAAQYLPVADLAAVGREGPERVIVGGEVVEMAVQDEARALAPSRLRAHEAHAAGLGLEAPTGRPARSRMAA